MMEINDVENFLKRYKKNGLSEKEDHARSFQRVEKIDNFEYSFQMELLKLYVDINDSEEAEDDVKIIDDEIQDSLVSVTNEKIESKNSSEDFCNNNDDETVLNLFDPEISLSYMTGGQNAMLGLNLNLNDEFGFHGSKEFSLGSKEEIPEFQEKIDIDEINFNPHRNKPLFNSNDYSNFSKMYSEEIPELCEKVDIDFQDEINMLKNNHVEDEDRSHMGLIKPLGFSDFFPEVKQSNSSNDQLGLSSDFGLMMSVGNMFFPPQKKKTNVFLESVAGDHVSFYTIMVPTIAELKQFELIGGKLDNFPVLKFGGELFETNFPVVVKDNRNKSFLAIAGMTLKMILDKRTGQLDEYRKDCEKLVKLVLQYKEYNFSIADGYNLFFYHGLTYKSSVQEGEFSKLKKMVSETRSILDFIIVKQIGGVTINEQSTLLERVVSSERHGTQNVYVVKLSNQRQNLVMKIVDNEEYETLEEIENELVKCNLLPRISHPNILNVMHYFIGKYEDLKEFENVLEEIPDKTAVLLYPLCESDLLSKIQKAPTPEKELIAIMRQLVNAVCVLWDNNIVHRDLKLDNVLNGIYDILLLFDFEYHIDFNRVEKKENEPEGMKIIKKKLAPIGGNSNYLPPEITKAEDGDVLDYSKSDIYSVGIMLKEIMEINRKEFNESYSRGLCGFVENLCHKDFKLRTSCHKAKKMIIDGIEKQQYSNFEDLCGIERLDNEEYYNFRAKNPELLVKEFEVHFSHLIDGEEPEQKIVDPEMEQIRIIENFEFAKKVEKMNAKDVLIFFEEKSFDEARKIEIIMSLISFNSTRFYNLMEELCVLHPEVHYFPCNSCFKWGWKGEEWKCLKCPSIFCGDCYLKRKELHPLHAEFLRESSRRYHKNVICDGCDKQNWCGERYKCMTCDGGGYDLCGECIHRKETLHKEHELGKVNYDGEFIKD